MENSKKIWGTLRSTTPAAIMNVIMKTTSESLASRLTVKRKYKVNVNGSVGKWWFVVRGEKFDIDATWDRVSLQTAWKLEDVYSFTDKELDPSLVSSGTLVNTAFIEKNYSLTPISTTTVSDNPSHNPDTIISPDEIIASNNSVLCNTPSVNNNSVQDPPSTVPLEIPGHTGNPTQ